MAFGVWSERVNWSVGLDLVPMYRHFVTLLSDNFWRRKFLKVANFETAADVTEAQMLHPHDLPIAAAAAASTGSLGGFPSTAL